MPYKDASPISTELIPKEWKKLFWRAVLTLFLISVVSQFLTQIILVMLELPSNTTQARLLWAVLGICMTFAVGLFYFKGQSWQPEQKRIKSPRPVILSYKGKVIVFHIDPPENERMTQTQEADFWAKTVYVENQMRQILNEHPNADLKKYEHPLGMKIISVESANATDDTMPIGEPY